MAYHVPTGNLDDRINWMLTGSVSGIADSPIAAIEKRYNILIKDKDITSREIERIERAFKNAKIVDKRERGSDSSMKNNNSRITVDANGIIMFGRDRNLDGTGPAGEGPRTGRGLGVCDVNDSWFENASSRDLETYYTSVKSGKIKPGEGWTRDMTPEERSGFEKKIEAAIVKAKQREHRGDSKITVDADTGIVSICDDSKKQEYINRLNKLQMKKGDLFKLIDEVTDLADDIMYDESGEDLSDIDDKTDDFLQKLIDIRDEAISTRSLLKREKPENRQQAWKRLHISNQMRKNFEEYGLMKELFDSKTGWR